MAGTGKSTISLTIARGFSKLGRLAASFFFSRGAGDLASTKKFATTIAAQLMNLSPRIRSLIEKVVVTTRGIRDIGLYDQWEKLVLEPLAKLERDTFSVPLVIVVDALDECDSEDDTLLLIRCLAAIGTLNNVRLRVFVTSRPEQPINLGFNRISHNAYHNLILHDIEQSTVDQDLAVFYRDRLSEIARRFGVGDDLFSDENVRFLVKRSGGLFIHAATVCRFIHEGRQVAAQRLALCLAKGENPAKPELELDFIYTTILTNSIPNQLESDEISRVQALFRRIVGSIVVFSDTMTPADLAVMVEESEEVVLATLHCLHSLLDVPVKERGPGKDTRPIRLLHPSFRDFLLNPARCRIESLAVNAEGAHAYLSRRCLQVMKEHLHRNMCQIERPGMKACDIPDAIVRKFISGPVRYACRFWLHHLQHGGIDPRGSSELCDFLRTCFPYWLETLALIGRLSDGVAAIRSLEAKMAVSPGAPCDKKDASPVKSQSISSWVKAAWDMVCRQSTPQDLAVSDAPSTQQTMVYDAMRFLLNHSAIIEEAPLQIYCSALAFSPEESWIRQHYSRDVPDWIDLRPRLIESWSPYLQSIIHPARVYAVAYSPDGQWIASTSSDDKVRIWDATGTERLVLVRSSAKYIVFAPNKELLASGGDDGTIRLFDTRTGLLQHHILAHAVPVKALTFYPNGQLLLSVGTDATFRFWDVNSGEERRMWRAYVTSPVEAVSFSPDADIALLASQNTVQIANLATGAQRDVLRRYACWAASFSSDGRFVAVCSPSQNTRALDLKDSTDPKVLTGRSSVSTAITFSPDSRLLACGCIGGTLQLWDLLTGRRQYLDPGHSSRVNSIAFSPNGRFVISASDDGTVRLWDSSGIISPRRDLDHCQFSAPLIDVSPLSGRVVTVFYGVTQLWDLDDCTEKKRFRGHSTALAFSSDGRLLALALSNGVVQILDTTTAEIQCTWTSCDGSISAIAFSPDGRLLLTASSDTTVRLWDPSAGTYLCSYPSHLDVVRVVTFSSSGHQIAAAGYNHKVWVWDTTTGATEHVLDGPGKHFIEDVAFSPDGQLIAVGGLDQNVQLWESTTGLLKRVLGGHEGMVNIIRFSPDSQLLASASHDETIRLWDLSTSQGELLHVYHIGCTIRYLSFGVACLVTEQGTLPLPPATTSDQAAQATQATAHIFASTAWIRQDNEDVMRLPHDIQEKLMFVSGNRLLFQGDSGPAILELGRAAKSMIDPAL